MGETILLDDLLMELLTEVANYLDFRDVRALRKASPLLHEATNHRLIWYNFAKDYCSRHLGIPRPDSGNFEDLSADELRHWVWRRLLLNKLWQDTNYPPPRTYNIRIPSPVHRFYAPRTLRLLPGGRWLLCGHPRGTISYFDLESPYPLESKILLSPQNQNAGGMQHMDIALMAIWRDSSTDHRTRYIMACVDSLSIHHSNPSRSRWYINKDDGVNSSQDDSHSIFISHIHIVGKGPGASLELNFLTAIPLGPDMWITPNSSIGISDEIAIRQCPTRYVEAFRWQECSKEAVMSSTAVVDMYDNNDVLYPIGNDRILGAGSQTIKAYRLPQFRRTELATTGHRLPGRVTYRHAQLIWSYHKGYASSRLRPAFSFDGNCYRLVFTSYDNHIVGVVIPEKGESPYVQFNVSCGFTRYCTALGIFKSVVLGRGSSAQMPLIRFSARDWNEGSEPLIQGDKDTKGNRACFFFDEETGRGVVYLNRVGKIKIVDLLPNLDDGL